MVELPSEDMSAQRSGDLGAGAWDDLPVAGLLGLVVGAWAQLPSIVVDRVVMSAAEQREVVERRPAALGPVPDVMGLGARRRSRAVREDAAAVAEREASA
jgi:hypothetical protein